jgi:hypothetical protein
MIQTLILWPQARTAIPKADVVFPLPWPVITTTSPFLSFGVNRVTSTTYTSKDFRK